MCPLHNALYFITCISVFQQIYGTFAGFSKSLRTNFISLSYLPASGISPHISAKDCAYCGLHALRQPHCRACRMGLRIGRLICGLHRAHGRPCGCTQEKTAAYMGMKQPAAYAAGCGIAVWCRMVPGCAMASAPQTSTVYKRWMFTMVAGISSSGTPVMRETAARYRLSWSA